VFDGSYPLSQRSIASNDSVCERWDARGNWRGFANAVAFSAMLWAMIGAAVWVLG
jgi:hypothetical protein